MQITNFNDLIQAARYEVLPQRLLFLFVAVELPPDSTEQQRADFDAGQGGTLTPIMCVDKRPQEVESFATLSNEAKQFGKPWGMVFAASISGMLGEQPSEADIDKAFEVMVEDVKLGRLDKYILFDRDGQPVQIG